MEEEFNFTLDEIFFSSEIIENPLIKMFPEFESIIPKNIEMLVCRQCKYSIYRGESGTHPCTNWKN